MAVSKLTHLGLILTLSLPGAAADWSLINLVMPGAQTVAGISAEQARTTPFGQFVLSRLQAQDANFQKLIAETGFDPRTDLTEVVLASESETSPRENGLVVARGRFDVTRILAAAQKGGAAVSSYKGVQVVTRTHGRTGKQGAVAFPDPTLALAGDPAMVQAALDRRGSNSALDAALAAKVAQVSAGNQLWFVTNSPSTSFGGRTATGQASNQAMTSSALKSIQQLSGGLNFGQNVVISAEAVTRSEKDATALADVVRFMTGLLQANTEGSPQHQRAADLLNSLQLTTSQNLLKVSLSVPEDQLESMVRQRPQRAPGARRHRPETQLD